MKRHRPWLWALFAWLLVCALAGVLAPWFGFRAWYWASSVLASAVVVAVVGWRSQDKLGATAGGIVGAAIPPVLVLASVIAGSAMAIDFFRMSTFPPFLFAGVIVAAAIVGACVGANSHERISRAALAGFLTGFLAAPTLALGPPVIWMILHNEWHPMAVLVGTIMLFTAACAGAIWGLVFGVVFAVVRR